MSETAQQLFETDEERDQALNPDIDHVTVGRKKLRKIEIYPLSLADQLSMTEVVVGLVNTFLAMEESSDLSFIEMLLNTTQGHFKDILGSITEDEDVEVLLGEITNRQAQAIGEKIYEMNYSFLKKKIEPWIKKLKERRGLAAAPSLQPVSEDIPSTTFPTTTENDSQLAG